MVNTNNAIDEISAAANKSLKALREGNYKIGYDQLTEFTEKMYSLVADLSEIEHFEAEAPSYIRNVNSILNQVMQALVNKDAVMITDLLEFELIPLIEQLKSIDFSNDGDC